MLELLFVSAFTSNAGILPATRGASCSVSKNIQSKLWRQDAAASAGKMPALP